MLQVRSFFVLLIISSITYGEKYACNANLPCGCSYRTKIKPKIIGGERVVTRSWGWIVSIAHKSNGKHFCGGSILSNSWILTAAHCMHEIHISDIIINAGSNELNQYTQQRQVANIIRHPGFNHRTYVNDIALIQLAIPLDLISADFARICLPQQIVFARNTFDKEYPIINSTVVAIGWGQKSEDIRLSATQLQQVTLKTIAYESNTCRRHINSRSTQFCAGVPDGIKDTCHGDSGGPLMGFTVEKRWTIVGITSFGIGCGRPEYSGIYTRVAFYTNWINTTIYNINSNIDPIFIVNDSLIDSSYYYYSFSQIYFYVAISLCLIVFKIFIQ